ncbi:MAG TPA: NAD(P)-dependent oxidoreductase [Microlunatus sp.]|nr:NAD(P)-dependent oxidoreductase [Microlunatus sp.]
MRTTEQLAGRRVLVTGAAGQIGSATTALLTDLGAVVTTLSNVTRPDLAADRVLVGDTRSESDVADALDGVELVVHLAALPHPSAGTPYDVYSINVVSTFNVLAQAGERGIRRAVIASSINAFGIPFNPHDVAPAYFPIDASIPVDLADWYSLSKFSDEQTARMAHRRWGIDVVAFRFPLVAPADRLRRISERYRDDPGTGMREGWSYLDLRDAARVIALALVAELTGVHALFLAADRTLSSYPTEDLLDAYAPGVPRLRRFVGREVPMDLVPVRTLLGFRAEHELDLPTLPLPPVAS